jgi:hypothetical protein
MDLDARPADPTGDKDDWSSWPGAEVVERETAQAAEGGALSAGEDCSRGMFQRRGQGPADGVDAGVDAVEAAGSQGVADLVTRQPRIEEDRPGDRSVVSQAGKVDFGEMLPLFVHRPGS